MSLSPEQIATRRTGVTSTDASAIVGLNPYKSALEVYAAKVGEGRAVEDNEAMWWGRALEPVLAARYAEPNPGAELTEPGTMQSASEPWMLATPDRLVYTGAGPVGIADYGLELKTAFAAEQVKRWGSAEDSMPWEYIVQCQWCMAVTGLKRWDVAVLLGTYHGMDYREYTLHYDDGRIMTHPEKGVIARCRHFWFENVQKGIPPEPDGSPSAQAAIASMYPRVEADVVLAVSSEEIDALEDYQGALMDKRLAERNEAGARQALELLIGDREGMEHPDIGTVMWKAGKGGKRRWNSRGIRT